MNGKSVDIAQQKLEQLKQVLPEAFSEGKLDLEKLRLSIGEDIAIQNERYVLNWAGKGDAFRALQTPTTATLAPVREESVNFDETENIFIEGENLEVLKVLQKSYYGKIKMIYIDPPYNTGGDSFVYPDKFSESREEYLKRIEAKDEEGYVLREGQFRENSKDSGHYHSNWLSMMYPRLFLARNLLREDGVIFVSIDDNEVHNLRLLMNEIFGEDKFIAQFIWKSRQNKDNRNVTGASIDHEYILCYGSRVRGSERKEGQYTNPDNDPRGDWSSANMVGLLPEDQRPNCHYDLINPQTGINYGRPKMGWRYDQEGMNKLIEADKILWPNSPTGRPRRKLFLSELQNEYTGYSSVIAKEVFTRDGTKEIEDLFGFRAFDFPKPLNLIKELIIQGLGEDEIVLDFFAGSSPIGHAIYELNAEERGNRKYICVQLAEQIEIGSDASKNGFKTISKIAIERLRLVINQHKKENPLFAEQGQDLGFKVFKLKHSNFKLWRGDGITDGDQLEEQLDLLADPVREAAQEENLLTELLLKSGFELTTKVEKKTVGEAHYWLAKDEEGNSLAVALQVIDETLLREMITQGPQQVICLDRLFTSDQLKTNIQLQCKDAGIVFRAI